MAKDYSAIARAKIIRASEIQTGFRGLIYGRNKKGKTHLCATADGVLIIDAEMGSKEERKVNPNVWPVHTWPDIEDVWGYLNSGQTEYHTIAIDGLTRLSAMSLRWVMKLGEERDLNRPPNQVGKQDYGRSGQMIAGFLYNLHSLQGVDVLFTAGERLDPVTISTDDADDDADAVEYMMVPDLPKGIRATVNQIVDVTGRIYTVTGEFEKTVKLKGGGTRTKTVEGVQRRLWIGPHAAYDTGARSSVVNLPNYIEDPTIPKLVSTLRGVK